MKSQQYVVQRGDLSVSRRVPGISGYMRVRDEEQFLALAIESHLPFLDELVIVYNACTDGTPGIAADYQRRYPEKVRVFNYEPVAYPPGTDEFVNLPADSPNSLVNYYNFTLCKTTRRVAVKVDGDHVAIPENFGRLVKMVRKPWLYFGRGWPQFRCLLGFRGLNVWDRGGKFFVNVREPFTEYVLFFPVSEQTWFTHDPRWEVLECRHLRFRLTQPFGFYHLKFVKRERDRVVLNAQESPQKELYVDEIDRRTKPELLELERYCAQDRDARNLPAPEKLGIVPPIRSQATVRRGDELQRFRC